MPNSWGARGSDSPTSKLTEAQVRTIKLMLRDGTAHQHIAVAFGVAPSTISRIAQGLSWSHVRIRRDE